MLHDARVVCNLDEGPARGACSFDLAGFDDSKLLQHLGDSDEVDSKQSSAFEGHSMEVSVGQAVKQLQCCN